MKVHNIVKYDSDGNGGETCRIILCFADREKAEERIHHLKQQFRGRIEGEYQSSLLDYPTFHIVTKKVIGERKIEKEVLFKYRKK